MQHAWRGTWNRHTVAPSRIFLHRCHFFNFCKKMQKKWNRPCPLPYEEAMEAFNKTVNSVQNNMRIWRIEGKTLRFLMGRTEGENRDFSTIGLVRIEIHQKCSSSMNPSWHNKKGKEGLEGRLCPNFWLLYICICGIFRLPLLLYCGALIGCPDISKN